MTENRSHRYMEEALQTSTERGETTISCGHHKIVLIYLWKDAQFILGAFPMNERLIFNRTYAGYRGSLTFTEDIYDNN